jgi:hypothetical protein
VLDYHPKLAAIMATYLCDRGCGRRDLTRPVTARTWRGPARQIAPVIIDALPSLRIPQARHPSPHAPEPTAPSGLPGGAAYYEWTLRETRFTMLLRNRTAYGS